MASYDITSDTELKAAVRAETSYEDTADELPDSQLTDLIDRAKHKTALETGSEKWYSDSGLGFALVAYTCMRAKSAVENAPIVQYNLGDESVQLRNADPDTSQQVQMWASDVQTGLDASAVDQNTGPQMTNTSSYIGEDYVYDDDYDEIDRY
jgi:hypothetical protein